MSETKGERFNDTAEDRAKWQREERKWVGIPVYIRDLSLKLDNLKQGQDRLEGKLNALLERD